MRMRTVVAAMTALTVMALGGTALAQKPATGSLTIAFGAESNVLDVTRAAAGVDWYFNSQIYEQLLHATPDLKVVDWLVESWALSQEGGQNVIDVRLRRDVKFHDGSAMTADDLIYSYDRLRDPKISRWSHYQSSVDRMVKVDDHRFKIFFKEPDASYISNFLQLWAIPKAYYQKVGDEGVQNHPVGTGPWKFVSRKIKEELKLEAFDDYWNKGRRPSVKNLTIKIIPEDATRIAAFRTGAVDWIDAVPPAEVAGLKALPGVETASFLSGNNLFLQLNTHMPDSPFNDLRVRKAAAHAIDVDGIIKNLLFGQGERYAVTGKGALGYDPSIKPYEYDPAKARQLLAEAGYANGFEINCYNLLTPREPYMKEMGEAMFAYLSQVGIRCRTTGEEYAAWITRGRRSSAPEMDGIISWMWGHGVIGEPSAPWGGHVHSYVKDKGWGSYSYANDPELDQLIEDQAKIMNLAEREAMLRKIGRLKHERLIGGIPTYQPMVTFAWRGDKVNYTPWPWPGFWRNLQEIGLKR